MIDIDFINIKKIVDASGMEASLNKRILSAAVGMTVGRMNQLPTSEVDSINEYYYTIVKAITEKKVFYFNEQIVIDLQYALDTARSYYIIRYKNTYPSFNTPMIAMNNSYDIYSILSGVDQYVAKDDYDLLNTNSRVLITLINNCIKVMSKKVD
jgi:hypothetical protein